MEIGPMQNFQYFIGCNETNKVAVVDPAWDTDFIIQEAENKGYAITKVLLTHGHQDHSEGATRITERLNIPVLISMNEAPYYVPECPNLEAIKDHQIIKIGNIEVEAIFTPGPYNGLCLL